MGFSRYEHCTSKVANFALAAIEGNNKEINASLDQLKKDAGNDAIKSAIGLGFRRYVSGAQGLLAKNIRINLKSQH